MKLFVIEGVDGSGKSTQLNLLRDFLTGEGYKCEYLHFPRTDSPFFGELIARFLRGEFGSLNDVDPYLVAMLYAGDRRDAAETIRRWLNDKKIVLLDRYTYSNVAYQCAKLEKMDEQERLMNWILRLEFEHFAIPVPDLNIFLDVPFSFTEKKLLSKRIGDNRDYLNGNKDIHEDSLDLQRKVREIYLRVASAGNHMIIVNCFGSDGLMQPPGKISLNILELIRNLKLI
jgi:dTMP kinase